MHPGFVFLIIIGAVIIIAVLAFFLYLYLRPRLKKDDKPTEEQIVEEEMNRILQPIDDEKTAKEVEEYKDDEE